MCIYLKHVESGLQNFTYYYIYCCLNIDNLKLPFYKDPTIPYIARFVVKLLQLRSSFSWLRTSSQGFVEVILKFVFLRIEPLRS